ncbi:MAG: zf-HC2 domain-containing protein [Bryobacterales bacterium]|nr:zf-HC2 domain-containing protein [Bryobacterales bacterium]
MSCPNLDWKAYVLGESPTAERAALDSHLAACAACREEVARLGAVMAALGALPQEEPPRRLAFVSDKIFEPGFWSRFWNSAPRVAFASAAMLAAAILVHAFTRPAPVAPAPGAAQISEARIEAEVARRLEARLEEKLRQAEERQARRTAQLVTAAAARIERRYQAQLLAVEENLNVLRKRWGVLYTASAELGGAR